MMNILETVERFLVESGMSASRFGVETVGSKNLVKRLRAGGDVTARNAQKIMSFIEAQRWLVGKAARSRRGGDGVVDATSHQPAEGAAR